MSAYPPKTPYGKSAASSFIDDKSLGKVSVPSRRNTSSPLSTGAIAIKERKQSLPSNKAVPYVFRQSPPTNSLATASKWKCPTCGNIFDTVDQWKHTQDVHTFWSNIEKQVAQGEASKQKPTETTQAVPNGNGKSFVIKPTRRLRYA